MKTPPIRTGCASWNIPKPFTHQFPEQGTHLERYACIFDAVEINSSFYRPHKPSTYERWASSVPEGFLFSVKVPKLITHKLRLKDTDSALHDFLDECSHLGTKLGPLLVQLPPSLTFDEDTAHSFFTVLRKQFSGDVACEPRHPTWFAPEPDGLLSSFRIARVVADPAVEPKSPEAASGGGGAGQAGPLEASGGLEGAKMAQAGGWSGLVYYRLHGSPRIYYSAYSPEYLSTLAQNLREAKARASRVWCIFDNTAEGAATGDALTVMQMTNEQS